MALIAALVLVLAAVSARAAPAHARDDAAIERLACQIPHQVRAVEIADRSYGRGYTRVAVSCAVHGEDAGFALRARTQCSKRRQAWQCRPSRIAWSIATESNVVDVEVTPRVPAARAAELVRYAAGIREFQQIPIAPMIAGLCRVEPDGDDSWLLHCTGLTLAIARDCASGGCRYRAFATSRSISIE